MEVQQKIPILNENIVDNLEDEQDELSGFSTKREHKFGR